jgi:hypothetical protein
MMHLLGDMGSVNAKKPGPGCSVPGSFFVPKRREKAKNAKVFTFEEPSEIF